MTLSIIVAMANNNVIGVDNNLPWRLPADLKYFKAITMGKPIIMGRKTYESIGRPLPGRRNIVITRDREWHVNGVEVANSIDDAMKLLIDAPEAMIIGGAQIYSAMLPHVTRLYITEIDLDVAGDTYFPETSSLKWRETSREQHPAEAEQPAYDFAVYDRL